MYKDLLLQVHWYIPCNISPSPANSPNLSLLMYYQFLWITPSYIQSPRKSLFFQLPFAIYVPVFKSGTRSYQFLLHLMPRSLFFFFWPWRLFSPRSPGWEGQWLLFFNFKLDKILLVLPNIEMNLPQVYMCSLSWTLLPPHTIPLGRPSAPAPSIQYRASNLDWQLVSYMILYMFQCHSPKSSHPHPLQQSP